MTATQAAENAQGAIFAPMRYDVKGFTSMAIADNSSIVTGGRKMGPRDIGRASRLLASQQAGILPMTATQAAENAKGLAFALRHDTKGFTSTSISRKNLLKASRNEQNRMAQLGMGGARKQGPREIGRARGKLASENAGIAPMSAADARRRLSSTQNMFAPKRTRAAQQGFSTTYN